jgi:hemerythrin-like metal-binding protein
LEWDDSLATGDAAIDDQHRRLIALLSRLEQTEAADGPDAVRAVLDGLTNYTSAHFTMEEDLMAREDYPAEAVERHVHEHRALTQRVRGMVLEYRTGELATIEPLVKLLRGWLRHHVDEIDRLLVDHVRVRHGAGPA